MITAYLVLTAHLHTPGQPLMVGVSEGVLSNNLRDVIMNSGISLPNTGKGTVLPTTLKPIILNGVSYVEEGDPFREKTFASYLKLLALANGIKAPDQTDGELADLMSKFLSDSGLAIDHPDKVPFLASPSRKYSFERDGRTISVTCFARVGLKDFSANGPLPTSYGLKSQTQSAKNASQSPSSSSFATPKQEAVFTFPSTVSPMDRIKLINQYMQMKSEALANLDAQWKKSLSDLEAKYGWDDPKVGAGPSQLKPDQQKDLNEFCQAAYASYGFKSGEDMSAFLSGAKLVKCRKQMTLSFAVNQDGSIPLISRTELTP